MTLVRDKKKQITKATSLRTDQKEGRYFRSKKRETNRSRKKKGRKGTKKKENSRMFNKIIILAIFST